MRLIVHANILVAGLEEVVESHADSHLIFRWNGRKEAATQDDNGRARQLESRTVEQDKVS